MAGYAYPVPVLVCVARSDISLQTQNLRSDLQVSKFRENKVLEKALRIASPPFTASEEFYPMAVELQALVAGKYQLWIGYATWPADFKA